VIRPEVGVVEDFYSEADDALTVCTPIAGNDQLTANFSSARENLHLLMVTDDMTYMDNQVATL